MLRSPLQFKNNMPYGVRLTYDDQAVNVLEGGLHYVPMNRYMTFVNFKVGILDDTNTNVTAWSDDLAFNKFRSVRFLFLKHPSKPFIIILILLTLMINAVIHLYIAFQR